MNTNWLRTTDRLGQTALARATQAGYMRLAEVMLEQEKLDNVSEVLRLPRLHRAAYYGFEDVVREFLEEGDDPDAPDTQGETPLHKAARVGCEEVAGTLLSYDAAVNVANQQGMTPLHWAAIGGHEPVVEMLLSQGAGARAQVWAAGGLTPIDLAQAMGYKALAKRLRDHGRQPGERPGLHVLRPGPHPA